MEHPYTPKIGCLNSFMSSEGKVRAPEVFVLTKYTVFDLETPVKTRVDVFTTFSDNHGNSRLIQRCK